MGLRDQQRAALRTGKCDAGAGELTTDTSATVTRGYRKARQRPGLPVVDRLLDPAQAGDHAIHSGHKRALRTRICRHQHPCEPLHSFIDNGPCRIGATPGGKLETRDLTYRDWILCRECVDSDVGTAHAGDATNRAALAKPSCRPSSLPSCGEVANRVAEAGQQDGASDPPAIASESAHRLVQWTTTEARPTVGMSESTQEVTCSKRPMHRRMGRFRSTSPPPTTPSDRVLPSWPSLGENLLARRDTSWPVRTAPANNPTDRTSLTSSDSSITTRIPGADTGRKDQRC